MAQAKRGRKSNTSKQISEVVKTGEVILANEPDPKRAELMASTLNEISACLRSLDDSNEMARVALPITDDGALLEGEAFVASLERAQAASAAASVSVGLHLLLQKSRMSHGEWTPWREAHGISKRGSERDMKNAAAWMNLGPAARQKLTGLPARKVTALTRLGHAEMEDVLTGEHFEMVNDGTSLEVEAFVKLRRERDTAEAKQRDTQAKLNDQLEQNKRLRSGSKKEADTRRLRLTALHHGEVITETTRELERLIDELRSLKHDAVTKSNIASQICFSIASGVAQLQECWDLVADVSPPPEDGVIAPEFKLGDLDELNLAAQDARNYVQNETTRIHANRAFVGSRRK